MFLVSYTDILFGVFTLKIFAFFPPKFRKTDIWEGW